MCRNGAVAPADEVQNEQLRWLVQAAAELFESRRALPVRPAAALRYETGAGAVADRVKMLVPADVHRTSVAVENTGAATLFIVPRDDGVTAGDGKRLAPGAAVTLLNVAAVYAICAAGETTTYDFLAETGRA